MIKAIIFDFFGVLVTERLKQFLDEYFPDNPEKRKQAIDSVTRLDLGRFGMTEKKFLEELGELAGIAPEEVKKYLDDNKPNELLLDYIKTELKPKYKIGVLSNASADYLSKMLSEEDRRLFDDAVLSYRFSIAKPMQEIYELAAERLNVLTTECVFIDDSPSHCEGAKRAGMKTVWYEDFPQLKKDLEKVLAAGSNH